MKYEPRNIKTESLIPTRLSGLQFILVFHQQNENQHDLGPQYC